VTLAVVLGGNSVRNPGVRVQPMGTKGYRLVGMPYFTGRGRDLSLHQIVQRTGPKVAFQLSRTDALALKDEMEVAIVATLFTTL
jgi:hypothetical protein